MARLILDPQPGLMRAALVSDKGTAARIWLISDNDPLGSVHAARVTAVDKATGLAWLALHDGEAVMRVKGTPPVIGALLSVTIVRLADDTTKLPLARLNDNAVVDGIPRLLSPAPTPLEQIRSEIGEGHETLTAPLDDFGLERELHWATTGQVPLVCGGVLLIAEAAGNWVIDVNSAASTARPLTINLEAMTEIARLVPAWGLGGNILVDFITPKAKADAAALEKAARRLPCRHTGLSPFGTMVLNAPRDRLALPTAARAPLVEAAALAARALEEGLSPRPGDLNVRCPLGLHAAFEALIEDIERRTSRHLTLHTADQTEVYLA